jgi:hypothetical protein
MLDAHEYTHTRRELNMQPVQTRPLRGSALAPWAFAALMAAALPAAAQFPTKPLTPSQQVSPTILVNRIDANCGTSRAFIRTVHPTELAAVGSQSWAVVDAATYDKVQKVHSSIWTMQAWKQAGNYVWIHSARLDASGGQHATQLCFRTDGTLARARQAKTVPALDSASARQAYFNTDGSLIRESMLFETNDPAIYKRITNAPFFKLLN